MQKTLKKAPDINQVPFIAIEFKSAIVPAPRRRIHSATTFLQESCRERGQRNFKSAGKLPALSLLQP